MIQKLIRIKNTVKITKTKKKLNNKSFVVVLKMKV